MGLKRISALQEYDYPPYAYDVTGWTVRTQVDGEKVGKVDDLVVAGDGEPRYLDVDLGFLKKHVLLPLEYAHADPVDEVVVVEGMNAGDFESVPPLNHDPVDLTLDYERRLSEAYRTAGDADAPGVAVVEEAPHRFVRLDAMEGFHIRGDDDPRGWKVLGGDGGVLGKAVDLLIDRESMRAAYLLVAVDEKPHGLERIGRHVLIPIGRVRLTDNRRVLVDGLFARDVGRYPVYGGLPVPDDALDRIESFFKRLIGADAVVTDVSAGHPRGAAPARHPRVFFGTSRTGVGADEGTGPGAREVPAGTTGALGTREPDARRGHEAAREGEGAAVATPVADRPAPADSGGREGDDIVTLASGDREIRIRLRGDDIVIERAPTGEDRNERRVDEREAAAEPPLA